MKIWFLIALLCFEVQLMAQSFADNGDVKIYNAEELITIAKDKGLREIEKIVDPIDIVEINPSYASIIIDLEFKSDLFATLYSNKYILVYQLPKVTLGLAEHFGDIKAGEKLFEYYSRIPKFVRSDTIYPIYYGLNDFLSVLVMFKSPGLIERLKKDFDEWTKLAQIAQPIKYPTHEEFLKTSFEESRRFKYSSLYVDCNYVALQIAGALNYLKVKGFDDAFIEKLKAKQSFPFAKEYTFHKPTYINPQIAYSNYGGKVIPNSLGIKSFRADIAKIERVILENYGDCCEAHVSEVIEDGTIAYVCVAE